MFRSFTTFRRLIIVGCKNFVRNAWLSVAATAVMVVALTIALSAIVLNTTARNAISELSKNLKVSIYLKDDVSPVRQQALKQDIIGNTYVSSIQLVSKDDAQRKFVESFQNDTNLIEGLALVGGQTLPSSFEVSVNDIEKINEVGAIAQDKKYGDIVDSVTLGKTDVKKTIDRAAAAQKFIIRASIMAAALFTAVSILIIFNTIRMAIFTRSEEIKIMKLIGATPNYIRGPFLIESCLYGGIAGLAANAIIYSSVVSVGGKLSTQPEFAETYIYYTQFSTLVFMVGGAVLCGILVGIISSILAMEKHLKLKKW